MAAPHTNASRAGIYALSQQIVVRDRPLAIRGEGIGLSRLIWASASQSAGLCVIQVLGPDMILARPCPAAVTRSCCSPVSCAACAT